MTTYHVFLKKESLVLAAACLLLGAFMDVVLHVWWMAGTLYIAAVVTAVVTVALARWEAVAA